MPKETPEKKPTGQTVWEIVAMVGMLGAMVGLAVAVAQPIRDYFGNDLKPFVFYLRLVMGMCLPWIALVLLAAFWDNRKRR